MPCETITIQPIEPTLAITDFSVELSPAADKPNSNEYGLFMEIHVAGTGVGTLKLEWGSVAEGYHETKTGIREGNYAYGQTLPHGTHQICAKLFGVKF